MAKRNYRRTFDRLPGGVNTVAAESHWTGELTGKDSIVVEGRVVGHCKLEGSVIVSVGGHWEGDVNAQSVLVGGRVDGSVTATNHIELLATARVVGRLQGPVIAIAEGAIHEGEIRMGDQSKLVKFTERRG